MDLYKSIVKSYNPKYISQPVVPSDTIVNFFKQKQVNPNVALSVSMTIHGLEVPYFITDIELVGQKRMLASGYATQSLEARDVTMLIYDLFFTFNLDLANIEKYSELHAHLVGEYPLEVLTLLFEEVLAYDYVDSSKALESAIPVYETLLSKDNLIVEDLTAKLKDSSMESKKQISDDNSQNLSSMISPSVENLSQITPQFGSPVTAASEAHSSLFKRVNEIVGEDMKDFAPLLKAINERAYSKALRIACNASGDKKLETKIIQVVEVLLSNKGKLAFNINEQAGSENYAAIHYAAMKKNNAVYDLLVQYGGNVNLPDEKGGTPFEYMKTITLNL